MKILFVCKGNMFRSPIAEAIASRIVGKENVSSAGTYTGAPDEPEGLIVGECFPHAPEFLEFMKGSGLDISKHTTKHVTSEMVARADVVVDMAEEPYDLEFLKHSRKVVRWDVPNDATRYKEVFEILTTKINELLSKK